MKGTGDLLVCLVWVVRLWVRVISYFVIGMGCFSGVLVGYGGWLLS